MIFTSIFTLIISNSWESYECIPWILEQFHEQDAGRATCGSRAQCSFGTCESHYNFKIRNEEEG